MTDYDTIKAQQANFPLPAPQKTIAVGTYDASSGEFTYAVPTYSSRKTVYLPDPTDPGGPTKPVIETLEGGNVVAINVVKLMLRFDVVNGSGTLKVTNGSASVTAPTGQTYVEIDAAQATSMNFHIVYGQRSYSPDLPLRIDRHLVGAGAITIPALPITIVYAPPVDQQKRNVAAWAQDDVFGTTTTLSLGTVSSSTTPVQAPISIEPWTELAAVMNGASKVLNSTNNAFAQAVGAALGVIAGVLGTSANDTTITTSTNSQNAITVVQTSNTMISTMPDGGGPGHADTFYLLLNARVCWYVDGRTLRLALVGWDERATLTADELLAVDGLTGLTAATRAALLSLDPFVAQSGAVPPSPRFVSDGPYKSGGNTQQSFKYTYTDSDLRQTVQTQMDVEDDTASLLAFANIGVPTTGKLQWTMTHANAVNTTTERSLTRQYLLHSSPGEVYDADVYVDTVFQTYAFRVDVDTAELSDDAATFAIPASNGFTADGGATLAGFVATGSRNEDLIASITGWQPGNGSHPSSMFVKRARQGGTDGIWFRVNFVDDVANGTVWLTLRQGGAPRWDAAAQPTSISFDAAPFH